MPALSHAARDGNLDVRRAAVRSLGRWAERAEVAAILRAAADDPDADVRAYARRALALPPDDDFRDSPEVTVASTGVTSRSYRVSR